jgi:hypothetical protein
MMTSPSQVNDAECQRPEPCVRSPTPGSRIVYRKTGSSSDPPGKAFRPMSNTFVASALAQAARLARPWITPMSWQPGATPGVTGPSSGSMPIRLELAGSSSGTSTMSIQSQPLETLL